MNKIAFVYDAELDFGGVETHLLSLFRHLDRNRFSPILISPISKRFHAEVDSLDVKYVPVPQLRPLSLQAVRNLTKAFRQEKIDLVHMHSPIAAISGRIAAKLTRLPAIVTVHSPSTRFYGNVQTFRAAVGRMLYVSIDRILNYTLTKRIVYVSNTIYKESLRKHLSPAKLSMVILNGIDLSRYSSAGDSMSIRNAYVKDQTTLVICFAGRLSAEKGIDILLDALSDLRKLHPHDKLQLWIIGDGAIKQELMGKSNRLNLTEVVQFLGFQNDLSGFLHASDIFVLPSRHEAMPIVLLEAMASGLPCIVTNVGENAEVIENGVQGIVIPPNQTSVLVQALEALQKDPDLRKSMGLKALERANNYSDLKTVEKIQDLYTELLVD